MISFVKSIFITSALVLTALFMGNIAHAQVNPISSFTIIDNNTNSPRATIVYNTGSTPNATLQFSRIDVTGTETNVGTLIAGLGTGSQTNTIPMNFGGSLTAGSYTAKATLTMPNGDIFIEIAGFTIPATSTINPPTISSYTATATSANSGTGALNFAMPQTGGTIQFYLDTTAGKTGVVSGSPASVSATDQSAQKTFSSLQPNTTYYTYALITANNGQSATSSEQSFKTQASTPAPNPTPSPNPNPTPSPNPTPPDEPAFTIGSVSTSSQDPESVISGSVTFNLAGVSAPYGYFILSLDVLTQTELDNAINNATGSQATGTQNVLETRRIALTPSQTQAGVLFTGLSAATDYVLTFAIPDGSATIPSRRALFSTTGGTCTVEDFLASKRGLQQNFDDDNRFTVEFAFRTSNCAGKSITYTLMQGYNENKVEANMGLRSFYASQNEETFVVTLKAGEDACDISTKSCATSLKITDDVTTYETIAPSSATAPPKFPWYVGHNLDDTANTLWEVVSEVSAGTNYNLQNAIQNHGQGYATGGEKCLLHKVSGFPQGSNTFSNASPLAVTLTFQGNHCRGKTMDITLVEVDTVWNNAISALDDRTIVFPENEIVQIYLKAGEDECSTGETCTYALEIDDDSSGVIKTYNTSNPNFKWKLEYSCDGDCDQKWFFQRIEPNQNSGGILIDTVEYGTDPNCIDKDGNALENCYGLLAPLPGLTRIDGNITLSQYINTLVQIAIGLIGLLAFAMIIVGGLQYMSTDAINDKTEGRKTILGAILGLLLALGSFVLLNTINPDLTRLEPDIHAVSVDFVGGDAVISPENLGNYGQIKSPVTGVYCPLSGGASELEQIVNSLNGKVSYRFGGKNLEGTPPYSQETTAKYKEKCNNDLCLDCTGFAQYVLHCAGMLDMDSRIALATRGTATIFNSAIEIGGFSNDGDTWFIYAKGSDEESLIELEPGGILGWKPPSDEKPGHAIIYLGEGKTAESTNGKNDAGKKGNSVRINNLKSTSFYNKKAITHYLPMN